MAAPHGTRRARLRTQLTGETLQQAHEDLTGPDGVPDAAHPEQIALEAAILSELHETFAGEHQPIDDHLYGMTRVQPRREGLILHLADDVWEEILDLLLPAPDPNPFGVCGVPGLRCHAVARSRIELTRPGTPATVTLQLPKEDAADAKRWIANLPRHDDPMRSAPDWTPAERAALPGYQEWVGDPAARSRILRRLLAFRELPAVSLINETGEVPTNDDLQQLLSARHRRHTSTVPLAAAAPQHLQPADGRPLVLAVTSSHSFQGQGRGGQGRTTVAVELARALAAGGHRVLLIDADPHDDVEAHLATPPEGLRVERAVASIGFGMDADRVRELAADPRHGIVILDTNVEDQRRAAGLADRWLGVASIWQHPSPQAPFLVDEALGSDGRALPAGWDTNWLQAMRTHRWEIRWRLAPRDFDGMFAPFEALACAGIVLLGERAQPGARAADYLQNLTTDLPVITTAVPFSQRSIDEPAGRTEQAAYTEIGRRLFGRP
ncbi:nucleotide-binding protein [Streptomyces nigrescens]|uniref:nucleotide-binding protein n=1 Tax=Streptomyces nigrescens TaxID=1920 RepID=UPI0037015984